MLQQMCAISIDCCAIAKCSTDNWRTKDHGGMMTNAKLDDTGFAG